MSSFQGIIEAYLAELHARIKAVRSGAVATYIPELATASPEHFGICVATVGGRVHAVGDTDVPFTIQSISKPLVYGLALDTAGEEQVRRKVGVEPTGEAFNSISLEPATGRPLNPMINAGAIATTSLVPGADAREREQNLLDVFGRYAGRTLGIDERVFRSELETGHRNRAIGHLLRNFDILEDDPNPTLELYFKQCSIAVTCRDLAVMAATLANGGLNPLTRERAVSAEHVPRILSVMTFAGLYDFAGGWGYTVGLPAKSGVGGGMLAVLPGQLGIGVYSPPLDEKGNSVRGLRTCQELSAHFGLHFLNISQTPSPIRETRDGAKAVSRRRRQPATEAYLQKHGESVRVLELQGRLTFPSAEIIAAAVESCPPATQFVLLDFARVLDIDGAAERLLIRLLEASAGTERRVIVTAASSLPSFVATARKTRVVTEGKVQVFEDRDLGLEWYEDTLLEHNGYAVRGEQRVPVSEMDLLQGISEMEVERVAQLLVSRHYAAGSPVINQGDPADTIFLLVKGEVSVVAEGGGKRTRLTTLPAGSTFGELALFDSGPRSAHVYAETDVVCMHFAVKDFEGLAETAPGLQSKLLKNMLRNATRTTRRLTSEVTLL